MDVKGLGEIVEHEMSPKKGNPRFTVALHPTRFVLECYFLLNVAIAPVRSKGRFAIHDQADSVVSGFVRVLPLVVPGTVLRLAETKAKSITSYRIPTTPRPLPPILLKRKIAQSFG
jgi:hypothetical protein